MSTFDFACLGTSLTSSIVTYNWPVDGAARLQQATRRAVVPYNFGYPGATSAVGLARIGAAVSLRPRVAILEYGANDAYDNTVQAVVPMATFTSNVRAMLAAFRTGSPQTHLFLMTMNPFVASANVNAQLHAGVVDYYAALRVIAGEEDVGLIDNTPGWTDELVMDNPALPNDGLHPGPAGLRAVLVPNLVAALAPLVDV